MIVKLSVLMAVYNAEKTIHYAVKSILNQTFKDFEFVIINDASTDDTLNIIQAFKDPRIKIITNKVNIGQTLSLNLGLRHCAGELVARMDADDISLPNRLQKQIDHFNKFNKTDILATRCTVFSRNKKKLSDPYSPVNLEELYLTSLYRSPINHISVMFKKKRILENEGYCGDYNIAADFDLWSRMLRGDATIKVLKSKCVSVYIDNKTLSRSNRPEELKEKVAIVRENIKKFCDIEIDSFEAINILQLHERKKNEDFSFIRSFILWQKILSNYSLKKNIHFWIFRIKDFVNIMIKYF